MEVEERALYVAIDFSFWEAHDLKNLGQEIEINGRCYRRLDATYYAFLRACLHQAKKNPGHGEGSAVGFTHLMDQFGMIYSWALDWIGEQEMDKAVARMNRQEALAYQVPKPLVL